MEKGITADELATSYPRLYHMAAEGSWPGIRKYGLLSTKALLDLFEIQGAKRKALEEQHRPESIRIEHPAIGWAVVRDQKPMDDAGLARALQDGIKPHEWYCILNEKVFFWLTQKRLETLLEARAYRRKRHTVLTLDTQKLLNSYADQVLLSHLNSGATKPFPHPRGRDTFLPLSEYPYSDWKKKRGKDPIVELAVTYAVRDVERFTVSVYEIGGEKPREDLL